MKNFKKVISAVIALALSASTLVAVSASTFSDVDNTSYAEAIDKLAALDIVHGYEEKEGFVFKPNGDITRAEAATMIVGALNMTEDAKSAAGTSRFTDVNEQASWAAGYVNVGVAQGFIHGMDETTFAPQENVTYAQMCVMLTLITGYGEYAEAYGGYPTGYTTMAASSGINKGVASSANTPLKRGQVAQMLYNALTTPMLGIKSYSLQGNEYEPQDGTKGDFKTLLADKFEGYEIDAKIVAVPNNDATLEKNEVKVSTTKTAGEFIDNSKTKQALANEKMIDDFGVTNSLFAEGKAIIAKDANDKWHLVYFKGGDNNAATLDAADYSSNADGGKNADATPAGDGKITFGSKNYEVNTASGAIYVNGVNYAPITEANVSYVLDKAQGEVKLLDDDDTVAGYDKIMATVYDVAKVTAVTYTNDITTIQVTTKAGINTGVSTIKISDDAIADKSVALTVKNEKGKIELSKIKKDDIIAFAIAPGSTGTITDPDFIDILVTDKKISGKATREDASDEIYTIDEEEYKEVVWGSPALTIGTTYTIALDPFGRIYDEEIEATSAKYAIAEKFDSDDKLLLVLPDGSSNYYELDATTVGDAGKLFDGTSTTITLANLDTYIKTMKASKPAERVVKYTIKNSTGKIQTIDLVGSVATTLTYKARTEKLGSKSIIDSTAVIDASGYVSNVSEYSTFAIKSFSDKTDYVASVFDADGSANTAAFVVLTEVGKTITADSRFAVVRKAAAQTMTEDGDTCYSVNVLYEGKEQDLLFTTASGATALNVGDAFFFVTDSEGLVKSYLKVFNYTAYVNNNLTAFVPFTGSGSDAGTNATAFTYSAGDWDYTIKNAGKKDYQLVYGIVTDVTRNGIEMAIETPANTIDLTNDANYEVFGIDADMDAYRYGKNEQTGAANQYKAISAAGATASTIDAYETGSKTDIYNLAAVDGNGHDHLVYALALIVDGDVVEIYTIVQ